MTKTLLDGVNDVLRRRGEIKSNSGELASLTDSQRQTSIDLAIQAWNESVIDLYDISEMQMPNEMATSNIMLITSTRAYTLPTDLVMIRYPLIQETNGYTIYEYGGGWDQMRRDQLQPSNYTGRPSLGCIRPSDGKLYLDRTPTSVDNGLQYTLTYDKSLIMSLAADTFPFNDEVYYMMVATVAEKLKMETANQNDTKYLVSEKKYQQALGKAAGLLSKKPQRSSWLPEHGSWDTSDPLMEG